MKKHTALVAILLISTTGFTQLINKIDFGVKAGVNLSNVNLDGSDKSKARTGLHVGILANYFISSNFSVQPELNYSQMSFEGTFPTASLNINFITWLCLF